MEHTELIRSKIVSGVKLKRLIAYWIFRGYRTVFTNGCFDIMHRGHVEYLAKAAGMGEILIVGLNSDSSVKKIKAPPRPLQDENSRSLLLASLSFVNCVILFDEETPVELIRKIKPHIILKGGDYKIPEIAGHNEVLEWGGKVMTIDLVPGYSTTGIISRMIKN